jgi:hypothetical protein
LLNQLAILYLLNTCSTRSPVPDLHYLTYTC